MKTGDNKCLARERSFFAKKIWGLFFCTFLFTNVFSQVSFTADVTSGCLPLEVNFTNTSTLPPATYYEWNFGGGPSVNAVDTSYIFTWEGNYNVTLTAYDTTGGMMNFIGSYSLPGGINASGSNLYFTADTVCANEEIEMYLYPYGNTIFWDFGDGNTSNQDQVTHSYSANGTYTVTVTANTSCGFQTITQNFVVMDNAIPNASFYGNTTICPNDFFTFYPQNFNAASYSWDFGDGNNSTDNQPTHSWATSGVYSVTLTMTSTCGTSDTHTEIVTVQDNLFINDYVQIWQSSSNGCPGDVINFDYNMNEANITLWNFGDGNTSDEKNTDHSYATSGTYNVTLYLENGCGNDTLLTTTIDIVTNLPFGGNPGFNINPNPVCPGDEVYFFPDNAVSYLWDFGDGNFSTDQFPSHNYSAIGNYDVNLTLTNGCGSDTLITATVVVDNTVVPVLDNNNWGAPANEFCPGDSAIFYAFGGDSYLWEFGDGTTTSQTTELTIDSGNGPMTIDVVYHAYSAPGVYEVVLTYYNSCGNNVSDTMDITIGTGLPANGGFALADSDLTACTEIDFISFGGGTYDWDFGDGQTLTTTATSATNTYSAPGNYSVTLQVTNGCGNSASYMETMNIEGMTPTITSLISTTCSYNSDGETEINVSGGTAPYLFSIDGNVQQADGIFTGLTAGNHAVEITDANNCISSINVLINSPAEIILTTSSVNSTCGNFDGSADVNVSGGTAGYTYQWSSGGTASTEINLQAGVYNITVTDANSCNGSTNVAVNDDAGPVVTYPTVYSAMCMNESPIVLSGGNPAGGIYSGNGVSSGTFDPNTAGAGIHTIIYSYTNLGCTSSASQTIEVNDVPIVTLLSYDDVCLAASPITLSDGFPAGGIYSGTGISAGIFDPSAATAGTHTVTYTFTDGNNCAAAATATITVIEVIYPTTYSPVCIDNGSIVLSGGSPAGGDYSGTGVVAGSFDPTVAGAGTFTVVYSYSSGACTASAGQDITVNDLPVVTYPTTYSPVCLDNGSIVLSGGSPSGGDYSGTGVVAGSFDPTVAGAGTFTVVYSYSSGACTASAGQDITVNDLPVVDFSITDDIACEFESDIILSGATPSGGIYSGTGVTAGSFSPTTAGIGTYLITYTYTDVNLCSASDVASISVDDCLGINTAEKNNSVSVFPNPFSQQTIISVENVTTNMLFELFDMSGKQITVFNIVSDKTILDATRIAPGTYIYKVSDESGNIITDRIIVR